MIVTTAGRTNLSMIQYAKQVSIELNIPFVSRNKHSIKELQHQLKEDVLVVGKDRLEIHFQHAGEPMFFHPNSAMFRVKRLIKGESDPLIESSELKLGDSFLDCTIGLGSDSIVASYAVGHLGKVMGIEGNKYLAYIVTKGLNSWESGQNDINRAMNRIQVVHMDHLSFLKECSDRSFDVVYFDPMFEETIDESNGLNGLRQLGIKSQITLETIDEAKRVAKSKIVLKDHWKSDRFKQLGFTVKKRKTAKFHFGTIKI